MVDGEILWAFMIGRVVVIIGMDAMGAIGTGANFMKEGRSSTAMSEEVNYCQ